MEAGSSEGGRKLKLMKLFWGDGEKRVTIHHPQGAQATERPLHEANQQEKQARPQIRRRGRKGKHY